MIIKKIIKSQLPKNFREEPGRLFTFDKKRISKLKNRWAGKKCVIIGNGPSLNKIDFKLLENSYTFGVNGIFYKTDEIKSFKPFFYVVEDTAVVKDNLERINNYDCNYKFFPNIYKNSIKKTPNTFYFNLNRGFYDSSSEYFEFPRFSPECSERVFAGQSVTIINLQLAYYFGFTEVFLVGMDFEYKKVGSEIINDHKILSQEDDINHFHPEYFGKGKTWHEPKLDCVLKSYKLCKLIYEIDNRKIYNSTVGGQLDVFERKSLIDAF